MPVISWRRAGVTAKGTVELRERLKAHLECNLADAKLGVNKQVFRLLHSHASDIFHKGNARRLAEEVTEVFRAKIDRLRGCGERHRILAVSHDPLPGFVHGKRLIFLVAQSDLLSELREMSGEDLEEPHRRFVLRRGDHSCVEIRFLDLFKIDMGAPSKQRLCQTVEFRSRWMINQDMPCLQPGDNVLADAHGYRGFTQASEAFKRFRLDAGLLFDPLLHGEAGLTGDIRSRQKHAKRRYTLPKFQSESPLGGIMQSQRQTGGLCVCLPVIAINLRLRERAVRLACL